MEVPRVRLDTQFTMNSSTTLTKLLSMEMAVASDRLELPIPTLYT